MVWKPEVLGIDAISVYMKEVSNYPLLSSQEQTELLERKNYDVEAYNKLYLSNLRMVVWVAKKYYDSGVDMADLVQAGNIGLIKALNNYDASYGAKLITYAVDYIRAYIVSEIYNTKGNIRISRHIGSIEKALNVIQEENMRITGKPLSFYNLTIQYMKTSSIKEKILNDYSIDNYLYSYILDYLSKKREYDDIMIFPKARECDRYIRNFMNNNSINDKNLSDNDLSFCYNHLKEKGYVDSEEAFFKQFSLIKEMDYMYNNICNTLTNDSLINIKKALNINNYDDMVVVDTLINKISLKVNNTLETVVAIDKANTISLSSSIDDLVDMNITSEDNRRKIIMNEYIDNDDNYDSSISFSELDDDINIINYIIDHNSEDFISEMERREMLDKIHEEFRNKLISNIYEGHDMTKKFNQDDINTVLEFGKLYSKYYKESDEASKQDILSQMESVNDRINIINTKYKVRDLISKTKEKYSDAFIELCHKYDVSEEKIEEFNKDVNANLALYIPEINGDVFDMRDTVDKYCSNIVVYSQKRGLLNAEQLLDFVEFYQDNKDDEKYNLRDTNKSLSENVDYYIKGSLSPYAMFRRIDITDKYIFEESANLGELSSEYGMPRERVRMLVAKSKMDLMKLDAVKDYMKDLGGKNEQRTFGR